MIASNSDDGELTASTHTERPSTPVNVRHIGHRKEQDIRAACKEADIHKLQALAESEGGLLTDTLRQLAWPVLLGVSSPKTDSDDEPLSSVHDKGDCWKELPPHRDEEQVQLDVNRSFVYYPNGN
ncbi:hypothetical protein NQ176_g6472 [Zarea fungicola]|uniref:Uncharacterized protein n=1 Tax=Zarea fungicola TaxID=93591 RepID=A0ACC1N5H1_9HYPO|nr:hypothetical protein NQ176_g6472 [Lecanicillium fungicola]